MKKKIQRDALVLLGMFQKDVLLKKPDIKEMIAEIHMMKFRVKPLQGDLSGINFHNSLFIETLWSLGKLDEFFQAQYRQLSEKERASFYSYFDSLHKKFQEDLNRLNLKQERREGKAPVLEMEIYKDRQKKKRLN